MRNSARQLEIDLVCPVGKRKKKKKCHKSNERSRCRQSSLLFSLVCAGHSFFFPSSSPAGRQTLHSLLRLHKMAAQIIYDCIVNILSSLLLGAEKRENGETAADHLVTLFQSIDSNWAALSFFAPNYHSVIRFHSSRTRFISLAKNNNTKSPSTERVAHKALRAPFIRSGGVI